ncbi:MAG: transporter [Melioribacteraceae bacterium]|nr:transporter [Melioribacteraceae bacterium]
MKKLFTTVMSVLLISSSLFASGFQINEHGARAMSLGGAFTGLANDASAVYFNGAGMTQLSGTHFSLGATYIKPSSTFTGPVGSLSTESELEPNFFTPINIYATHQLSDKFFVGFALNNPYGLGTEWKDDWVGRYSAVETEIRTFNFSGVLAYKVSDQFSVSAGVTYSYADVLITRQMQGLLPTGIAAKPYLMFSDSMMEMEGDATAIGFNAAIMYKPTKCLSLGLAFKSEIEYDFEGDATTTYPNEADAKMAEGMKAFPYGKISAPMTTPMMIAFGAAYTANDNLTLTADFQYNGWESYDKLEVTFDEWVHPLTGSNISTSHREYENSFIIRGGGEYILNCGTALRAGLLFDKNPVQDERLDPTLPDADRIGFNLGIGYNITEKLSVDFAYFYLHFMEREIDNSQEFIPISGQEIDLNGKYESSAHLIGLNFNYSL